METRKFVAEIMWLVLIAFANWDFVEYKDIFGTKPINNKNSLKRFHSPIQIRPPPMTYKSFPSSYEMEILTLISKRP
jgi:hypothetical protein